MYNYPQGEAIRHWNRHATKRERWAPIVPVSTDAGKDALRGRCRCSTGREHVDHTFHDMWLAGVGIGHETEDRVRAVGEIDGKPHGLPLRQQKHAVVEELHLI